MNGCVSATGERCKPETPINVSDAKLTTQQTTAPIPGFFSNRIDTSSDCHMVIQDACIHPLIFSSASRAESGWLRTEARIIIMHDESNLAPNRVSATLTLQNLWVCSATADRSLCMKSVTVIYNGAMQVFTSSPQPNCY